MLDFTVFVHISKCIKIVQVKRRIPVMKKDLKKMKKDIDNLEKDSIIICMKD